MGLEAVADYSLWFWHSDFGFSGALNDINIWNRSKLHNSFLVGTHNDVHFKFVLDDEIMTMLWYLVDGIYPELAHFVKTMLDNASSFNKKGEMFYIMARRKKHKDIDSAFGVLQKKFNILVIPVRLFHVDNI